jgi:hypothetical protein
MERVACRGPQPQRFVLALLVSFVLIPGCGEPARKASHNLGPRFTPRVLCQEDQTRGSPTTPAPCAYGGGVWEWLHTLRP